VNLAVARARPVASVRAMSITAWLRAASIAALITACGRVVDPSL
jgi:hypothetical protein